MRARNIKPSFFKNEQIGTIPFGARLLFIGSWTLADRAGRLEDRPARIAAELFPYDRNVTADDVNSWLDLLMASPERFITRYSVGGANYIQIENFTKHQSPHVKEQASTIPAPDMPGACPVLAPDMQRSGQCAAPPDSLNPDSLNPEREHASPKTGSAKSHGSRFSLESLPDEWAAWCSSELHWDQVEAERTFVVFADYWRGKAGKDGRKSDWLATWRNWCRRERGGSQTAGTGKPTKYWVDPYANLEKDKAA